MFIIFFTLVPFDTIQRCRRIAIVVDNPFQPEELKALDLSKIGTEIRVNVLQW